MSTKKFGLFRTTVTPRAYEIVFTDVTAIREGVQNMLDAYDQAEDTFDPKKHVQYLEKTGRLVLWSPLTIPRAAMLQGFTTKEDGTSRGRYGEGLKAMCAVLGERVRIETEGENWSPKIVDSDVVPGEKVLAFDIRRTSLTGGPFTKVTVAEVTPDLWASVRRLCRQLQDGSTKPTYEHHGGALVLQDMPGLIYSKGLLVGKWEGARFGYDLPGLKVNRDRQDVAEYHIREEVEGVLIGFTANHPAAALSMLEDDTKEAESIAAMSRWYSSMQTALAGVWKEKYGEKVICMASEDDPFRAMAATGWCTRYGNKHLRMAVAAAMGGEDKLLLAARDAIAAEFPLYTLTDHERDVYRRGMAMAQVAAKDAYPDYGTKDKPSYHIVRFHGENVRGLCDWKDKRVSLKRELLEDLPLFLLVLTHEMAHYYSMEPDGAIGHTTAIEVMNMHLLKGCGL